MAKKKIQKKAKVRGFASVSGYIKYLINQDDDLISDNELWETIQVAQKEYKKGKAIRAKSSADFL